MISEIPPFISKLNCRNPSIALNAILHGAQNWVCNRPARLASTPIPHPHDDSAHQGGGPLVWYERAAYLSEGHLYLGITVKVKLGDGFAIFQNLYWCQFFGLSLLSRRKKLRKAGGKKEAKEMEKSRKQGNDRKGENKTQVR